MRKRIFTWLGKEFIELSGEAKAAANATIEAQELFQRIAQELKVHGLSLDNTVRTGSGDAIGKAVISAAPSALKYCPAKRARQARVISRRAISIRAPKLRSISLPCVPLNPRKSASWNTIHRSRPFAFWYRIPWSSYRA